MAKLKNFVSGILTAGALLFGGEVDAQTTHLNKTIRYIDPMMKYIDTSQVGIPGKQVYFKDNQTGQVDTLNTDSQGYVNVVTSVDENEVLSNKYNVQVYGDANGVNFDYNLGTNSVLTIYTIGGQQVKELNLNNRQGKEIWDLKNNHGNRVATGTYVYSIINEDEKITGRLIRGGRNIFPNNLQSRITKDSKQQGSLEKITTGRYTLEFVDNNNEFYRIIDDVDDVDNFMNTYEAIPKAPFQTPDLQGEPFLDYFKRAIGSVQSSITGDTISVNWLQQDMHPQKIFYNRGEAPSEMFNTVLESLLNEIEDSTQINYRGNNISRQNLFNETTTENEEGSINFNYSGNLGWTDWIARVPPQGLSDGAPYRATVFINNTFNDEQSIKRQMSHELFSHAVLARGGEYFPTENYPVKRKKINTVILSRVLSNYFNLSRIRN